MSMAYLGSRSRSFACAVRGLGTLLKTQPNVRIHLVACIAVLAAGAWCGLSLVEWGFVTLAIAGVFVSEAVNTAIELAVDLSCTGIHPLARQAKDVAAGAVLMAAIAALVIGLLVFGPRIAAAFAVF